MTSHARTLLLLALALPAFFAPTLAMSAGDDPAAVDDTRVVTLDLTGMT